MSTHLQAFAFDSHAVRVVMIDDAPWFVAKDVCLCLGISNHRDATRRLDADEKDGVGITDAIGRSQQTTVINESGLYALILRSDGAMTPGTPAHTFRKWVTAEVLPALRQSGSFSASGHASTQQMFYEMSLRFDRLLQLLETHLAQSSIVTEIANRALTPKPRRSHRPVTPEDIARARALKAEGMSGNEIARQLQRSSATVSWMVREVQP